MTTIITLPTEGAPDPERLPDPIEALNGIDGNAFSVMATTSRYLREAGASREYIKAYRNLATSSDYAWLVTCSVRVLDGDDPS